MRLTDADNNRKKNVFERSAASELLLIKTSTEKSNRYCWSQVTLKNDDFPISTHFLAYSKGKTPDGSNKNQEKNVQTHSAGSHWLVSSFRMNLNSLFWRELSLILEDNPRKDHFVAVSTDQILNTRIKTSQKTVEKLFSGRNLSLETFMEKMQIEVLKEIDSSSSRNFESIFIYGISSW